MGISEADRPPEEVAVAYVGVGGNLGDPERAFALAIEWLSETAGVYAVTASPAYRTRPVGPQEQDNFLNEVLRLETSLPPIALLDLCLDIERRLGRTRELHWGPRTIDLDLLLYDDRVVRHPRLVVPHPEMAGRGFVLIPLADLAPSLRHPELGLTVAELRERWFARSDDPSAAVWPA